MMIKLTPDKNLRVQKIRVGRVPVLILRPAKQPDGNIGLLWIHGGGYITGMKEMVYMSRAIDLVMGYGVTVYSPGYRLAWQKPYPAAVNDCYQVLEYMIDKEDTLMVGGESAGGGLAVAVCMMARDRGIDVAYQIPLYPMISNIDTESSKDNHGKVWNTRRNHIGWRFYLRGKAKRRVSPYAAPANQSDYSNLPPCYTFVGDGEPFYSETLQYVENLKKAGVEAKGDVYHTDIHAFDMLQDDDLSREAIESFNQHFEYAFAKMGYSAGSSGKSDGSISDSSEF